MGIFDLNELDQAVKLRCKYAFSQSDPTERYHELLDVYSRIRSEEREIVFKCLSDEAYKDARTYYAALLERIKGLADVYRVKGMIDVRDYIPY